MSWRYGGPYNTWDPRYYSQNNPGAYAQYNRRAPVRYDPRSKPLYRGQPSSNYRPGKTNPIINKQQPSPAKPGSKPTAARKPFVTHKKTETQQSSTKNSDSKPTPSQSKTVITPQKTETQQSSTKNADSKPTSSQSKTVVTPQKTESQQSSTKNSDSKPTSSQSKTVVIPQKTETQQSSTKISDNKPTSSQNKAIATPQKTENKQTSTSKVESKPTFPTKPSVTIKKTESQQSSTKNVDSNPTSSQTKAVTPQKAGDQPTSANKADSKPTPQTKPIVTTQKTDSQQMNTRKPENKPTPTESTVLTKKTGHDLHFNCCSYTNKAVSKSTVSPMKPVITTQKTESQQNSTNNKELKPLGQAKPSETAKKAENQPTSTKKVESKPTAQTKPVITMQKTKSQLCSPSNTENGTAQTKPTQNTENQAASTNKDDNEPAQTQPVATSQKLENKQTHTNKPDCKLSDVKKSEKDPIVTEIIPTVATKHDLTSKDKELNKASVQPSTKELSSEKQQNELPTAQVDSKTKKADDNDDLEIVFENVKTKKTSKDSPTSSTKEKCKSKTEDDVTESNNKLDSPKVNNQCNEDLKEPPKSNYTKEKFNETQNKDDVSSKHLTTKLENKLESSKVNISSNNDSKDKCNDKTKDKGSDAYQNTLISDNKTELSKANIQNNSDSKDKPTAQAKLMAKSKEVESKQTNTNKSEYKPEYVKKPENDPSDAKIKTTVDTKYDLSVKDKELNKATVQFRGNELPIPRVDSKTQKVDDNDDFEIVFENIKDPPILNTEESNSKTENKTSNKLPDVTKSSTNLDSSKVIIQTNESRKKEPNSNNIEEKCIDETQNKDIVSPELPTTKSDNNRESLKVNISSNNNSRDKCNDSTKDKDSDTHQNTKTRENKTEHSKPNIQSNDNFKDASNTKVKCNDQPDNKPSITTENQLTSTNKDDKKPTAGAKPVATSKKTESKQSNANKPDCKPEDVKKLLNNPIDAKINPTEATKHDLFSKDKELKETGGTQNPVFFPFSLASFLTEFSPSMESESNNENSSEKPNKFQASHKTSESTEKDKIENLSKDQLNKTTVHPSTKELSSKNRENELPIPQVDSKLKRVDFEIVFKDVTSKNTSKDSPKANLKEMCNSKTKDKTSKTLQDVKKSNSELDSKKINVQSNDPPKSNNTKNKCIDKTQKKDGVSSLIPTTESDNKVNTRSNNSSKDSVTSNSNEKCDDKIKGKDSATLQNVKISENITEPSKANVQNKKYSMELPASNTKQKCNDNDKDRPSVGLKNALSSPTSDNKEETRIIGCLKVRNMSELLKNGTTNLQPTPNTSIGSQLIAKSKVAIIKPVNIVNPNNSSINSSVGRPIPTISSVTPKHAVSQKNDSRPPDSNQQIVPVSSIPILTNVPNHTMHNNKQPCGTSQIEQPDNPANESGIPPEYSNPPHMGQGHQMNLLIHPININNQPLAPFPNNHIHFPIQPCGPPENIQNQGGNQWSIPDHQTVQCQFNVQPPNIVSQFNSPPPHFLHPHFGNPPIHQNVHVENNTFCGPYGPVPLTQHSSDYQWQYNSPAPYQDQQYNPENETTPSQYVQHSNYPTPNYVDYPPTNIPHPNSDVHPTSGNVLQNTFVPEAQQTFSNNPSNESSSENTTNQGTSSALPQFDQQTNISSSNENFHQCSTHTESNSNNNDSQEVTVVLPNSETDNTLKSTKNDSSKTNSQTCPVSNVNSNIDIIKDKEPSKEGNPEGLKSMNDKSISTESQDVIIMSELQQVPVSHKSSHKPDATKSNEKKAKEQQRSKTRSPEGRRNSIDVLKNKTSFELSKQIMQTMHTLQGQLKGIGLEKDFENLLQNFYGKMKSDFLSLERVKENRLDDENIALLRLNNSVTTLSNEVKSIKSKSKDGSTSNCRDEDILFPLASEICPNKKGDQDGNKSTILSEEKESTEVNKSIDNQDKERTVVNKSKDNQEKYSSTQGNKSLDDQILDFLSVGLQKFQQRNTNVYDRLHKSAHTKLYESCSNKSPLSEISSANSCYSNDEDSRSGLRRKTHNALKRKSPNRVGRTVKYPQGDPGFKYRSRREKSASPRRLSASQVRRRSISPLGSRPLYDHHVRRDEPTISRNSRRRRSLSKSRSKSPVSIERRSRHYVRRSLSRSMSRSPVRNEQRYRRDVEVLPSKISVRDEHKSWRPLRRSLSRSRSGSPLGNKQKLRRRVEKSVSRSYSRSPIKKKDKSRMRLRRSLTKSSSKSPIRSEKKSRRHLRRSLSRSSSRSSGSLEKRRYVKKSLTRSSSKSPIRKKRVRRHVRSSSSRSSSSRSTSRSPIRNGHKNRRYLKRSLSRSSSTSSVENDKGNCKQIVEKSMSKSTSRLSRCDVVRDRTVPSSNDVSPVHTKPPASDVPELQKCSLSGKKSVSLSTHSSKAKSPSKLPIEKKPKRKRTPIIFSPEKSVSSPISISPSPERVYSSVYPPKKEEDEDDDDCIFRRSTNSCGFDLRSKIKVDLRSKLKKRRVSPDTIYDKQDLYIKAKEILIERKVDQSSGPATALDKQKAKYSKNLEDLENYFRIRNKLHQVASGPPKSSEFSKTIVAPSENNGKINGTVNADDDINESVDDVLKYMEDHLEGLFNDDDGNSSKDVQLTESQNIMANFNLNTVVSNNSPHEIEEGEIEEPEEGEIEEPEEGEIEENDLRDILNLIKQKKGITRTSLGESEKQMLLLEAKTYLENKLIQIGGEFKQTKVENNKRSCDVSYVSSCEKIDVPLENDKLGNRENIIKEKIDPKELETPIDLPSETLPKSPQNSDIHPMIEIHGHDSPINEPNSPVDTEDIEMNSPKKESDSNGTENNDEDDFNFIEGLLADIDDIFENVEGDSAGSTGNDNSKDESNKLESESSERNVEQDVIISPEIDLGSVDNANNNNNQKKTHKDTSSRRSSEKQARNHDLNKNASDEKSFNPDTKCIQLSNQEVKDSKDMKDDVLDSLAENEMNMIKLFVHGIDTSKHFDKKPHKENSQSLNENKEQSNQDVTRGNLKNLTDGNASKEKSCFRIRKKIDETNIPFLECSDTSKHVNRKSQTGNENKGHLKQNITDGNASNENFRCRSPKKTNETNIPFLECSDTSKHVDRKSQTGNENKGHLKQNITDGNASKANFRCRSRKKTDETNIPFLECSDIGAEKESKTSSYFADTERNIGEDNNFAQSNTGNTSARHTTTSDSAIEKDLESKASHENTNAKMKKQYKFFKTKNYEDLENNLYDNVNDCGDMDLFHLDEDIITPGESVGAVNKTLIDSKKTSKKTQEQNPSISKSTQKEQVIQSMSDLKHVSKTNCESSRTSSSSRYGNTISSNLTDDTDNLSKTTSRFRTQRKMDEKTIPFLESSNVRAENEQTGDRKQTLKTKVKSYAQESNEKNRNPLKRRRSPRGGSNRCQNSESSPEDKNDKTTSRYPRRNHNTKRNSEFTSEEEDDERNKFQSKSRYPRRSNVKINSESTLEKDKEDASAAKRTRYSSRSNMGGKCDKEEATDKTSSNLKGSEAASTNERVKQDLRGQESKTCSNRERYPRRSNANKGDNKSSPEETKSTERERYPRRSNASHVSFAELDSDIEVLSDESSSEEDNANTLDSKSKRHSPAIKKSKLEPSPKNENKNKPAETKDRKKDSKMSSDKDQQSRPKTIQCNFEPGKGDNRLQKSAKGYPSLESGNIWKVQPVNSSPKCGTKESRSQTLPGSMKSVKSPSSVDSERGKSTPKPESMISPSTRSKDKASSSQSTSDQQMNTRKPNTRITRAK
ncbi:hypothetical protein WDU94_007955 [Cyamophila willieti]